MTDRNIESLSPESYLRYVALGLGLFLGLTLALPLVALGMPDTVRIPMLEAHDEGAALFSHWEHGQYRCYSCHTEIFPQSKVGFTHTEMKKGEYCGACHDGKTAWKVDSDDVACETCHVDAE
jgi:c(7)-type cytochrome triheme protein